MTQDVIPIYAPQWYGMYAMGSMITNVHRSCCRQYSKASLDRQVTQNGLGDINAFARGIYNGVVVVAVNDLACVHKDG